MKCGRLITKRTEILISASLYPHILQIHRIIVLLWETPIAKEKGEVRILKFVSSQ